MKSMIKAELLKQKYSFNKKLIFIAPIITILIAFLLMGAPYIQIGSYNWWYTLILPGSLTIISSSIMISERKQNFHGLFSILVNKKNLWYSKILTTIIYFTFMSLVFFVAITISGYLNGNEIYITSNLFACALLIILFIWQIPLWMFLSLKIGTSFTVIISIVCNMGIAVICAIKPIWWIPFSIPARIMCPVIGVLPNGMLVEANSPLLNTNVIPIGVIINLLLFFFLSYFTAKWFEKQEV